MSLPSIWIRIVELFAKLWTYFADSVKNAPSGIRIDFGIFQDIHTFIVYLAWQMPEVSPPGFRVLDGATNQFTII